MPSINPEPRRRTAPASPGWPGCPGRFPAAAAAALGLLFVALAWRWDFVVDDAFISLRYASHLAQGLGLVYNPGEWVEGYSNPSWTVLLAGLLRLGAPAEMGARLLGIGCGLVTLLLVLVGGRRILRLSPWAALAAGLVVASSRSFTFWSASGLETALFAALLLALWLGLWSPLGLRSAGAALLGLGAALLAVTRPEGAGALLALPAGLLLRRAPDEAERPWWRNGLRRASLGALVGVGLFALFLAWRLHAYGALLPNPFHAKVGGATGGVARGLSYLGAYLLREGLVWLLPLILLSVKRRPDPSREAHGGRAVALSLLATVGGYCLFIVLVGGDGLYLYRFPAQVLPLAALAIGLGVDTVRAAVERGRIGRLPAVAGLAAAFAVAALLPWAGTAFHAGAPVESLRRAEAGWSEMGRIVDRLGPPELTLATNVAGRLPFHADRPTLDLLGLTDAWIARRRVEGLGTGYAGHEKADAAYVLGRRPDLLHVSLLERAPPELATRPAALASRLAAGPLRGYAELFRDPRFLEAYRPLRIHLEGGESRLVFGRVTGPATALTGSEVQTLEWEGGPVGAAAAPTGEGIRPEGSRGGRGLRRGA